MFDYQLILNRNAELLAEAEQFRLVREAKRANKVRKAGDSAGREGGVRRAFHLAHR